MAVLRLLAAWMSAVVLKLVLSAAVVGEEGEI